MQVSIPVERTLTQLDYVRLTRLLLQPRRADSPGATASESLEDLLACSELVTSTAVAPDVATMYSQLLLADLAGGAPYKLTLCYPGDAEPAAGFVSVLSPVGMSLLGLRVGSIARWQAPHGGEGAAEILALLFQPEASGDYVT